MSYLVDTNILVYAANEGAEQYPRAKRFLEKCLNSDETWCFTWVNIFEYLRVVTHPGIFPRPMSFERAEENISFFINLPQTELLVEESNFFEVYREITKEVGQVAGNLVHDAHIAALMAQHGVKKIYTLDKQFRLFPFLKAIDPLG